MITSQGFGLIAELIAAALLIAALTGLIIRRSQPWLVGVTVDPAACPLYAQKRTLELNREMFALCQ